MRREWHTILDPLCDQLADFFSRQEHQPAQRHRAQDHPRVYTAVLMTHRIRGRDLNQANVRRAIALSMDRYCSVFAMLYPGVDIRERYEMTDDATGAVTAGDVHRGDSAPAAVEAPVGVPAPGS